MPTLPSSKNVIDGKLLDGPVGVPILNRSGVDENRFNIKCGSRDIGTIIITD
jgi:hypothetical protein